MYGGLFHTRKSDNTQHVIDGSHFTDGTILKSYFSPTDHATDNAVLPLINAATQTLDIAMFFFTSQPIADAILAAKQRGVRCAWFSTPAAPPTRLQARPAVLERHPGQNRKLGRQVPLEVGRGRRRPIVGSRRVRLDELDVCGDTQNDENTLYVKNSEPRIGLPHRVRAPVERPSGVPACTTVSAEGADSSVCTPSNDCHASCSSGSCCDGLDNDYDGKTDLQEESCACADGVDNDGDGYVDRSDYDCQNLPDP